MVIYWGSGLLVFFEPLFKLFLMILQYYSSSHSTLSHLYLYMTPLFFRMGSLTFGAIREVLGSHASFKGILIPHVDCMLS